MIAILGTEEPPKPRAQPGIAELGPPNIHSAMVLMPSSMPAHRVLATRPSLRLQLLKIRGFCKRNVQST